MNRILNSAIQAQQAPYCTCKILRNVKRGDFVKRKADSNTVYRKGDYDRTTKKYELMDCDDINRTIWVRADATVFVDFEY